ncbi:MAG: ribosome small subunit-dependent GTPase A [Clostridiaceae bacterium]|nr:ribosome small subunit-dependent GTPase A [Clostridiaceae bacterium]
MTGKIIKGIAGFYYVHDGNKTVYECKAKGIFRNKKIKPLVGDNVEITILDEAECEGNIDRILPRKNSLVRPAVANVDQALVVFSILHPEPNLNLLDRFLVMMKCAEVPVSILFNKVDLSDETIIDKYKKIYEPAGYEVFFTSTYEETGIDMVRGLLRGKTTVLAGPSGVGKSSLINMIQPEAGMETGTISEKIQRGKHTTRHSQLFYIEKDTFMMDTPGFSSMFVENMEAEELKNYFPEFGEFEDECRFLGCVHIGEKICGVKQAVEDGRISPSRYENYRLMYQELKDRRRY